MRCKQNQGFLLYFSWCDGCVRKTIVDYEGVWKYKHIVSFNYVENGDLVEKSFGHTVCIFSLQQYLFLTFFAPICILQVSLETAAEMHIRVQVKCRLKLYELKSMEFCCKI
jgi:hypothetical protein